MESIDGLGIKLKKLEESDLELVRHWRNSPAVSNQMIYRKEISQEEQEQWFHSINNRENFYYLILDELNEKVGLINIKDIDYLQSEGEGGIFMASPKDDVNFTAVKASLLMCKFGFENLNLKRITCRVLNTNTKAISYNKKMGYVFNKKDDIVSYGEITSSDFPNIYNKFTKILQK